MIELIAAILLTQDKVNFAPESKPDSPSGQFLTRRPEIDASVYKLAESDLNGTNILGIVRRTENGFQAWDMNGQLLSTKLAEIPEPVSRILKDRTIAIKIKQPIVHESFGFPRHQYNFEIQKTELSFDYIIVWGIVSVGNVAYVDIPFTISGNYVVGKLMHEVGSRTIVDGIKFEVKDNQKVDPADYPDCTRVFKERVKSPFGHTLGIELNRSKFIAEHPNDPRVSIAAKYSAKEKASSDVPEGVDEVFISGDKPLKYWEYITVKRQVSLGGFVKRVPTRPNG